MGNRCEETAKTSTSSRAAGERKENVTVAVSSMTTVRWSAREQVRSKGRRATTDKDGMGCSVACPRECGGHMQFLITEQSSG